jgi:hypothetical protein
MREVFFKTNRMDKAKSRFILNSQLFRQSGSSEFICMSIVVYVGLANLFSMFIIFVLTDFQTFQGLGFIQFNPG